MKHINTASTPLNFEKSQIINKYFAEIESIPMLTAEEEVQLARRIRQGDKIALEKLVKANLRFVVSVAKRFHTQYLTLNDLICEGNLGLINAAKRFDESKGYKFISYAVFPIRAYILNALSKKSRAVRIPKSRLSRIKQVKTASAVLEKKLEREPTEGEIADELKSELSEASIEDVMGFLNPIQVSLDAPVSEDEGYTLSAGLEDKSSVSIEKRMDFLSLREEVRLAISKLDSKEREIIVRNFGIGSVYTTSLAGIADIMNMHHGTISRLRLLGFKKLKNDQRLREFWASY